MCFTIHVRIYLSQLYNLLSLLHGEPIPLTQIWRYSQLKDCFQEMCWEWLRRFTVDAFSSLCNYLTDICTRRAHHMNILLHTHTFSGGWNSSESFTCSSPRIDSVNPGTNSTPPTNTINTSRLKENVCGLNGIAFLGLLRFRSTLAYTAGRISDLF